MDLILQHYWRRGRENVPHHESIMLKEMMHSELDSPSEYWQCHQKMALFSFSTLSYSITFSLSLSEINLAFFSFPRHMICAVKIENQFTTDTFSQYMPNILSSDMYFMLALSSIQGWAHLMMLISLCGLIVSNIKVQFQKFTKMSFVSGEGGIEPWYNNLSYY